jgi:hypothetical protein
MEGELVTWLGLDAEADVDVVEGRKQDKWEAIVLQLLKQRAQKNGQGTTEAASFGHEVKTQLPRGY